MRYFIEMIEDQNKVLKKALKDIKRLEVENAELKKRDILRADAQTLEIILMLRQQPGEIKPLLSLLRKVAHKRRAA